MPALLEARANRVALRQNRSAGGLDLLDLTPEMAAALMLIRERLSRPLVCGTDEDVARLAGLLRSARLCRVPAGSDRVRDMHRTAARRE